MDNYRDILQRVGYLLIGIGVVDIAVWVYCILNDISYASSFNIIAVIAGVLLVRGSLRAVRLITWSCAFVVATVLAAIVLLPFLQPMGLSIAELRTHPVIGSFSVVAILALLYAFVWSYRQLRRQPVLDALAAAGRSNPRAIGAFVTGALLMALLAGALQLIAHSEVGLQALELARAKVGPDYKLHVTSLHWAGDHLAAEVAAYKSNEVKSVQVDWYP